VPIQTRRIVGSLLVASLALLGAASAEAASLQQVSNWNGGVTGLPSDVSMYIYVPDKVATNPPILAVNHYCGGSAQAVFGQAQGGGLVKAADQYGFIMVVPSNANASGANGRCWDVTSKKAQTRDGGGDPHAIMQMVKYAIAQHQGNADRVYATGDSSGAMMTELLLALYPDVYKAGAAFAGVPAGCSNVFDGAGLCGLAAQTAQQWGDRVRAMDPGYSGHRPRVQLFHGDADATIAFKNMAEAIKEWTNVLGLSTDPASTQTGLTLGTHQAKRQQWKNGCGFVALDALTSIGGDHGPSDCLFVSQYVVPFLGLDKTGAVDPEIEQCGSGGGDGGVGGAGGTGGAGGSTGTAIRDSGAGGNSDGSTGAGGVVGSGGRAATDGSAGSGGSSGSGGSGKGGSEGSGGVQASGGNANGGSAQGGSSGSGGAVSSGGHASGGNAGNGVGGHSAVGGAAGGSSAGGDSSSSGCSCALGKSASRGHGVWSWVLALGLAMVFRARRTRARKP
jgi:acetylxylan esterase